MKVKVISDAHSNYPALKEATEDDDGADKLIYCGDIIGLMGFPSETVDYLRENFDIIIKGNHDIAVLEKLEGHVNDSELSTFEKEYVLRNLNKKQKEWVKNLPTYKEFDISNKPSLVVHANPEKKQDEKINYTGGIRELPPEKRNTRPLAAFGNNNKPNKYVSIKGIDPGEYTKIASKLSNTYDFLFLGHTHMQSHLNANKFGHDILIVNPGSVGQNFNSKPTYSIVDTENLTVEEKTVDPHKKEVTKKLKKEDIPKNIF